MPISIRNRPKLPTAGRTRPCAYALLSVLVVGCSDLGTRTELPASDVYEVLPASSVKALELEPISRTVFGGADSMAFVNEVRDLVGTERGWIVLDSYAKTVKEYDSSGHFIRRVARDGSGPGELIDPFALEQDDNVLYVVDLGRGKEVTTFNADGSFDRFLQLPLRSTATGMAAKHGRLAVLTSSIQRPELQGWDIVEVFDTAGRSLAKFCQLDPRYVESSRQEGMIGTVAYGSVSMSGSVVSCSQSISPVMRFMDLASGEEWRLSAAPPFYVAPEEEVIPRNAVLVREFLSKWTAHTRSMLVPGGFISQYSQYDTRRKDFTRWLFACRTDPARREIESCAVTKVDGLLLLAESLNRITLSDPEGENESAGIVTYRAQSF